MKMMVDNNKLLAYDYHIDKLLDLQHWMALNQEYEFPADMEEALLEAINVMRERFYVVTGRLPMTEQRTVVWHPRKRT